MQAKVLFTVTHTTFFLDDFGLMTVQKIISLTFSFTSIQLRSIFLSSRLSTSNRRFQELQTV